MSWFDDLLGSKTGQGLLNLGVSAATEYFGGNDPKVDQAGYQGGIPGYEVQRERVPNIYDPNRRPGSAGRRYFTDTQFIPKAAGPALPDATGLANINAQNVALANAMPGVTAPAPTGLPSVAPAPVAPAPVAPAPVAPAPAPVALAPAPAPTQWTSPIGGSSAGPMIEDQPPPILDTGRADYDPKTGTFNPLPAPPAPTGLPSVAPQPVPKFVLPSTGPSTEPALPPAPQPTPAPQPAYPNMPERPTTPFPGTTQGPENLEWNRRHRLYLQEQGLAQPRVPGGPQSLFDMFPPEYEKVIMDQRQERDDLIAGFDGDAYVKVPEGFRDLSGGRFTPEFIKYAEDKGYGIKDMTFMDAGMQITKKSWDEERKKFNPNFPVLPGFPALGLLPPGLPDTGGGPPPDRDYLDDSDMRPPTEFEAAKPRADRRVDPPLRRTEPTPRPARGSEYWDSYYNASDFGYARLPSSELTPERISEFYNLGYAGNPFEYEGRKLWNQDYPGAMRLAVMPQEGRRYAYGAEGGQYQVPIGLLAPHAGRTASPQVPGGSLEKLRQAAASGNIPMGLFAEGGIANLNKGMYLGGATDGMADVIPANIEGTQEARLSDGEFVMPADVVSHLGNGNSNAGAKTLYTMMDRIRKARTGTKSQGKEINPNKFLPV